ncbi:hypothetical protein D0439_02210 [Lysinibacillus fusiformis]|jgi:hypothetical protein|uniref:YtxH domain-containing protein n=4 Tax=Lysinibacillus TaxID=400634 RepID=A0A1E4R0Z6_9BACI|nr:MULTISPECIES: hypothetical protein [Lysinibacillus]AXQ50686.1 hypothetical protein DZC31_28565 [Stenotrophomonas rhizophila]EAZ85857.1 hypothetical protein BB14905_07489 [Bacillus sp. B14905]MBE5085426.1 hypothetical protein [Bacillus thuringiensis]HAU34971.1 hypothetical protein [Lysinibacillus sp.]ACA41784.1 hypothetical protein Bsph_4327 [Lysinibacillus sphaericus C3-41]
MAKRKGTGVVIAGLAGLAASYLSKKENRDKALSMFNNMKSRLESYLTTGPDMHDNIAERVSTEVATEAGTSPTKIASNEMVAEGGGHTGVHFYNEEIQDKEK